MKSGLGIRLGSALILTGLAVGSASSAASAQGVIAQHDGVGHSNTMTSVMSMMDDMSEMMDACAKMMEEEDSRKNGDRRTSSIDITTPAALAKSIPPLRNRIRVSVIDPFWMW